MSDPKPQLADSRISWRAASGAAALLTLTAAFLGVAAVRGDPRLHVPRLIAAVIVLALLVGALAALANAAGRPRLVVGLIVVLLTSFTITGAWIALGSGPRACTFGWSPDTQRAASAVSCRIAFGIGALVCAAMTLLAARQWMKSRD